MNNFMAPKCDQIYHRSARLIYGDSGYFFADAMKPGCCTNSTRSGRVSGENDRKVLLIGWDAADWKVASPLIDESKMPILKS